MMLPTLKALRLRHPAARLVLRTYKDYAGYLDHLVDQVVLDDNRNLLFSCEAWLTGCPTIHKLEADNSFARAGDTVHHYNFQGVIESRRDCHGVRAFAEAAGIDLGSNWKPYYQPQQRIVVQLRNNQDGRGLSSSDLPEGFLDRPGVHVIDRPLPPEDYVQQIKSADTFIGPDSSGLHLAAAMGVTKIIGYYHPEFPPVIRSYPNVIAFTDKTEMKKEIERMDRHVCPICENQNVTNKIEAYWQCGSCDAWFQDPLPPKVFEAREEKGEDGRSNGHNQSETDLRHSAHLAECWARNWINRIPLAEGRKQHKALDIGCKYPYFAHTLKKQGIEAYGIDGMDFDADKPPILSRYQEELGVPMLMVDFERVTPQEILSATEDKGKFDALSMVHVFEHMYQPYEALKNLRALLRDEGYFLVRVPSHEVPGMEWHMSPQHYSIHPFYYSEKSMRTLIDRSGLFEIVETYPMPVGTRDYILKPL